ncbi:response regulator transcription factor [Thalassotalea montiporae]
MHILIIEDDAEIARLTQLFLKSEGYDTSLVSDGKDALATIQNLQPDLVLLDLMLPTVDGFEICQQARTFYAGPILVMTAREDDMSEVSLLKLGADDYLRKPVKPHIMLARIEALLRRAKSQQGAMSVALASQLVIHHHNHTVTLGGARVDLTSAEFDLLALLASHKGETVSRAACIQALRGINYEVSDRSVDMRISGLRKKLGDEVAPYQMIKTIRNKGYMLVNE